LDIDGLKEYIMLRRLKGEGSDDEDAIDEAPTPRANSLARNRPAATSLAAHIKKRTLTQ